MLNLLKIEMIDWCYRRDTDDREFNHIAEKVIENFEKLNIDACCIERVSRDWATSFMQQIDRRKYLLNFHKTTIGNLVEGGSVSIRRSTPACCTIDHIDTITLPSSKPQPDGGQPGCLHVFEWNEYKFIMGCMPQNLGRDGTRNFDKQKYFDVIDQFWPNRKDSIDILPIAIWHEPHNTYQIHVWQLDIEDAIADDKFLNNYIKNSKKTVVSLVEEFGKNTGVVDVPLNQRIDSTNKNSILVYTNNPGAFSLDVFDVKNLPGVNSNSLAYHMQIDVNILDKDIE